MIPRKNPRLTKEVIIEKIPNTNVTLLLLLIKQMLLVLSAFIIFSLQLNQHKYPIKHYLNSKDYTEKR